jgi:hypothetical protein
MRSDWWKNNKFLKKSGASSHYRPIGRKGHAVKDGLEKGEIVKKFKQTCGPA